MRKAPSATASLLTAPGFLIAVGLLLTNDFILKPWLGNAFTGKLSDFAGLFAFPFFWAALLPRYRESIYVGTAVAFIFWKLPASDGLIAAWNTVAPFQVGRVVDPTDLFALLVLPLSYAYSVRPHEIRVHRWRTVGVAVISAFAFMATSYLSTVKVNQAYLYPDSPDAFLSRLPEIGIEKRESSYAIKAPPGSWVLPISAEFCTGRVDAVVTVVGNPSQSEVRLLSVEHRCPSVRGDRERLLEIFNTEVAEPMGMKPVD